MLNQRIDGATKLVGLLGFPVAHSISPVLHNHLFAHYGLNMAYVPLAVAPSELHQAAYAMRASGFVGANVTIPHKRQVMSFCDEVSDLSARVGAVNTLCFRDGRLRGDTTDATGFLRALVWMKHDLRGGTCLILGNGGTARSLAYSLALEKIPSTLTIAGRNREKAAALAAEISQGSGMRVSATGLGDPAFVQACAECSLCVNCTSVGMHPNPGASPLPQALLRKDMTVFDTVYNPVETMLLRQARAAGCPAQNGLRMLVYQGLASFTQWTGITVDESVIDFDDLQRMVAAH
jgi:shikimate dehydrogenase